MLDLSRLIVLREIKLQGSLTAAAQSLQVTVSAVSQQISRLERELGSALLERQGRRVLLTPAAHRLVDGTEEALAVLESAESDARNQHGAVRPIRLAAFHSIQLELLEPLLRTIASADPNLQLEAVDLEPTEALAEVSNRRADIAVVDEYAGLPLKPASGLVTTLIAREPMGIYFPVREDESHTTPSIETAAAIPWAMEAPGSDSHIWARNVCRELGFEPYIAYTSPDFHVHARLVRTGRAAAIIPLSTARSLATQDALTPAPGFPSNLTRNIYAVVRRGSQRRHEIHTVISALESCYRTIIDAVN